MTALEFHAKVIAIAKDQKIPIRQLEIKAGIPIGTIKSWKNAMPAGEKILAIANVLDVSIDYLFDRTNDSLAHKKFNYSTATVKLIHFSECKKISDQIARVAIALMSSLLKEFSKE